MESILLYNTPVPDDPKALSQQRFSTFAQRYVDSPTHAQGHDLTRLCEIANLQPTWTVLDIATGGGHTALKLAPHTKQIIACDYSGPMLKAARENSIHQDQDNISFCLNDAEVLPYPADAFDLVTCRLASHHFPMVPSFIKESARVLNPGSYLLLQDQLVPDDQASARFINNFECLRDPSHIQAFSAGQWTNLISSRGFEIQQIEDIPKRHSLADWAGRQGCSAAIIQQLQNMLASAPAHALAWMQPDKINMTSASFLIHNVIVLALKLDA